jgi:hypothetical protein
MVRSMTTRNDVQNVLRQIAKQATIQSRTPTDTNGEKLLNLLSDLEIKARAVGEEGLAQSARTVYESGQDASGEGRANTDLGTFLNNGQLEHLQNAFDSLTP